MEHSNFILVEWLGENRFSIITRSKIANEVDRKLSDEELVGKVVLCQWKKNKYDAKVLQIGEKINLDHELEVLTKEASLGADRRSLRQSEQADLADSILKTVAESRVKDTQEEVNYKDLLDEEIQKTSKLKNKVKCLKRKLKEYQRDSGDEVIQLSPNFAVKKSQLDMVKTISSSPTVFARNLMRIVFADEDLKGRSLFGRKCNANSSPAKEAIDSERRDAIILRTMEIYCEGRQDKSVLNEIHRSMGDFIREVTRRVRTELQF